MAERVLTRLLVFLAALFSTGQALAETRVALVFGVDAYKSVRPLDNAVNDAQAIEEKLAGLGFEVFLETNRDLKRMRRALDDFREDAAGADVALVFFAGHGIEISGENRLLPTDTDASSLDALKASTLPLDEVRDTVAATGVDGRGDPRSDGPAGLRRHQRSRRAGRHAKAAGRGREGLSGLPPSHATAKRLFRPVGAPT